MSRFINYLNTMFKVRRFSDDPAELIIFVTNKCNLNCEHCFYATEIERPNNDEGLMEINDYKKIANSLKFPLVNLILTGGEPFLKKDLINIIKIFNEINKTKQISIPTNGFLTDLIVGRVKEILKFFKGNLHIQISLDGLKKEHDEIRRQTDSFKQAVRSIKLLNEIAVKNKNLTVGINTTISSHNREEIFALADYVNFELKVSHNFELIRSVDYLSATVDKNFLSDFKPDDVTLSAPDDRQLGEIIKKFNYIFYRNSFYTKDIKNIMKPFFYAAKMTLFNFYRKILKNKKSINKNCKAGRSMGVIYPNGDFAVCELTRTLLNLNDYNFDLHRAWNEGLIKNYTKNLECYCTHGCFVSQSFVYDYKMILRFALELARYSYYRVLFG